MTKFLRCFFPYAKKSPEDDPKNQAFLCESSTSSSICELSYHHVDAVNHQALQKKIKKLEAEKAALVEKMSMEHESYKASCGKKKKVSEYEYEVISETTKSHIYYEIDEKRFQQRIKERRQNDSNSYMTIY
ncbi:unnamed protein product [Caenorhabditis sp. 36 PRJEB53466]|nr:unnamed protein product [Caenorhabditis sp. 36 PRJEB53466]